MYRTCVIAILILGLVALGLAWWLRFSGPVEGRKVVVQADRGNAVVSAWEKRHGIWHKNWHTLGYVGSSGLSDPKDKKEGDRTTPVGEYELRRAFGTVDHPKTSLPYTKIHIDDIWVDDPASKYYNQYIPAGSDIKRDWATAEELLALDGAYKYVIVVEYNTNPVVPGAGSAIFLACSQGHVSSGDIVVPEKYMKKLFRFVRPGDKIVIGRKNRN